MKNLTIFRVASDWIPNFDLLNNNLSIPGKLGYSWKILRYGLPYISVGSNHLLVCEFQNKLLPASVVQKELSVKIEKFEQETGEKAGKRLKNELKAVILENLYAKAFVTSKFTNVWINTKHNLLCIDTTSQKTADQIIARLCRDAGFDGCRLKPAKSVSAFMRQLILLEDGLIAPFAIGNSCVLEDLECNGLISYKNEFLNEQKVSDYIMSGRDPKNLEIHFKKSDSSQSAIFTLTENMVISKIITQAVIADRKDFDTDEDYFDNEFAIISGQCIEIINALLERLGEQRLLSKEEAA